MNTCPVYRRSGGHSYSNAVPGPIGSILAPAMEPKSSKSLPFACTLCGSCTDVCPVKIDIHHQLLTWRRELAGMKLVPWTKRTSMKWVSFILRNPLVFRAGGWLARLGLRWSPRWLVYNRLNVWGRNRDLPPPPKRSFRAEWARRKRADRKSNGSEGQ